MQELKKCPHCGGNCDIYQYYNHKQGVWFVEVKCDMCGARGKTVSCGKGKPSPSQTDWTCNAVERAISAWNMRYKEETNAEPDS